MAKIVILSMVAAAIFDIVGYQFLVKPVAGPHFLLLFQIWCESLQKRRSYGRLTHFKKGAVAILDFVTYQFYWKNQLRDLVFCLV